MPWLAVDKEYEFDGPEGKVEPAGPVQGRRQLIVYRAFFEPACTAGRITAAPAAP